MVVSVTNITDGPGKSPTQVDIYNKTLDPGATLRLPAELIDKKVRKLEEQGLIAIGQLPSWYSAAKARRGKALTPEEMQRRITPPVIAPVPAPRAPQPIPAEKLADTTSAEETDEGRKRKR